MLEFRILGPLEVVGELGPVRLGGLKQRATLAILLLSANRVVSVERLADDLYAGAAPVTAVTQVQRQISELRKVLGSASVIETRPPGYLIHVSADQLDLSRFERGTEEASHALTRGNDPQRAADLLRHALGLWRGGPLADLAHEAFAQTAIERLEEIRQVAVEQRIEAELALGRHSELVGELEDLVAEHPLRERPRGQLMIALYRSGRQPEALDVYRRTREELIEAFGIEPTAALRGLERAILSQDSSLELDRSATVRPASSAGSGRAVLVLPSDGKRLDALLTVARPLMRLPARELIIARLLSDEACLVPAVSSMNALRTSLGSNVRTAVFTTADVAADVVRLATMYDIELVLLEAPRDLSAGRIPDELASILDRSPADVGVLHGSSIDWQSGQGVFVPFGGGEHDWTALELGAWLASAGGAVLRLVGTKTDPRRGRRDASRLLADASLAVQRVVGVETEPLLVEPTEEAFVEAFGLATVGVMGLSPRWRHEGVGSFRRALLRDSRPPFLLAHGGPRPGALAPRGSVTRFTWTIDAGLPRERYTPSRLLRRNRHRPAGSRCACCPALPCTGRPQRWSCGPAWRRRGCCRQPTATPRRWARCRSTGLDPVAVGGLHLVQCRARPDSLSGLVVLVPRRDDVGRLSLGREVHRQAEAAGTRARGNRDRRAPAPASRPEGSCSRSGMWPSVAPAIEVCVIAGEPFCGGSVPPVPVARTAPIDAAGTTTSAAATRSHRRRPVLLRATASPCSAPRAAATSSLQVW